MTKYEGILSILPRGQLGPIRIQCIISEDLTDELMITEHPVERGAAITDHAYKRPPEVRIEAAWSQSQAGANPRYLQDLYKTLLDLQASRDPMVLVTGKRRYTDMLIQEFSVTTDKDTDSILRVNMVLRQVILVDIQIVTVPPRAKHKQPNRTGGITEKGEKQPVERPRSAWASASGRPDSKLYSRPQ